MNSPLTDLLREAAADVDARAMFVDDVVAAARRRARRRRVGSAALAIGCIAGLVLAGSQLPTGLGKTMYGADQPRPQSSPVSKTQGGPLSDGTTHGDLAADGPYLQSVRDVWRRWMNAQTGQTYDHPVGDAKVLWAGTTPAGPAALLEQVVDLPREVHGARAGKHASLGFIGVGGAGPRVAWARFDEDSRSSTGWYVDEAHRVLVVTDNAVRRGVSFGFTYHADGSATRNYTPLSFTDGAAIVTLPTGIKPYTVSVADLPWHTHQDNVSIVNVELPGEASQNGLNWAAPGGAFLNLPLTIGDNVDSGEFMKVGELVERATQRSYISGGVSSWMLYGKSPNGAKVRVIQRQLDTDPARLYLSYDGVLSDHGIVDKQAVLPVQIHLPDKQGWIVAQNGAALRYRIGTGGWTAARSDAALLPESATDVEITVPGKEAQVVHLQTR